MENIIISQVNLNDIDELQKIGRQTFYETFAEKNTEANMTKYLKEKFSLSALAAELTDKNAMFYFAKINKEVVGYLKLNQGKSQTEIQDDQSLEIERIYVLKPFHGKKVGQKLFDKALQVAKHKELDYIWLGVWEQNLRAVRFYKKMVLRYLTNTFSNWVMKNRLT